MFLVTDNEPKVSISFCLDYHGNEQKLTETEQKLGPETEQNKGQMLIKTKQSIEQKLRQPSHNRWRHSAYYINVFFTVPCRGANL